MTIRLVLADNHPLLLDGIVRLFEHEPDIEVVARCDGGEAALRAVRDHRPDVLLLDLHMPPLGGMEVLRRLAREASTVRVVLLTADVAEDDLLEAIRLGVRGIVLKETAPELLVRCVRVVHGGASGSTPSRPAARSTASSRARPTGSAPPRSSPPARPSWSASSARACATRRSPSASASPRAR